jgi:hypothetical protein
MIKNKALFYFSLLLSALLLIQGTLVFRESLGRYDLIRPTLIKVCHLFGYTLPIKRDLSKLAITEKQLINHPQINKSLRLKATLTNAANFAQPYPTLHLEFTDHKGKVVASRQLNTRDYLIDHQDNKLMPANSDVQIILDLVNPGKSTTGFALSLTNGKKETL